MSRQADPSPKRPFGFLVAAAVLSILAVLTVAGFRSYRDLQEARAIERRLQGEIEATRQLIERLEARNARLQDDPATLEKLAREELRMARPGDVLIMLPAADHTAPPPDRPLDPAPPPESLLVRVPSD